MKIGIIFANVFIMHSKNTCKFLSFRYSKVLFRLILTIFFGFPLWNKAQDINVKNIDNQYNITINKIKRAEISYDEAILVNRKLIQESKKIGYLYGELRSSVELGRYLNNVNKHNESIEVLNYSSKLNKQLGDSYFNAKIYTEYAKNYTSLGLYQKSLNCFNKALLIINRNKIEVKDPYFVNYVYSCKASVFQNLKQNDSLYSNIRKANKIIKLPIVSARIARFQLLYKNNPDSCKHYLREADQLIETKVFNNNDQAIVLRIYGLLNYTTKNYKEAVDYYKKSIEHSEKSNVKEEVLETAKQLFATYVAMGDEKSQLFLLNKYRKLSEGIEYQKRKDVITLMQKDILVEKQNERKMFRRMLVSISIIVLLIGIVWYSLYQNFRKRIKNKSLLLSKNKDEIKHLENKLNKNVEELYNMAKSRNPNFYTQFVELYPDFPQKLLKINSNLQNSELQLLAFIYMNFETKEIADILYKSPKTIQNRKHLIRKKLNISSTEDLSVWLKSI